MTPERQPGMDVNVRFNNRERGISQVEDDRDGESIEPIRFGAYR